MPQPEERSAEAERVLALVTAGRSIVVSGDMGIAKTARCADGHGGWSNSYRRLQTTRS